MDQLGISMEARITRHVNTIKWYIGQGMDADEAIAEVREGSIFSDAVWDRITKQIKEEV
jgi:hypothetical protein